MPIGGVAVLGGAGFIGSNLVDELMNTGHPVIVLDNLSEGKLANLERWRKNPRFEFVHGDITDFQTVKRIVNERDWVFHLAAMSRIQPSITDPLKAWQQNIMGTGNVLEACRKGSVKRVVYSASSSAYGAKNYPPMNEDMRTDCLNPYSLSKKVGEEMMELYRTLYGLSTVSLRYFNVYGPRHQEEGSYATVIAIFRKQRRTNQKLTVVGDGEQRRDFTFVGDVVRANMMAAMNRDAVGTFNIGTGMNFSINEVASLVKGEVEHIVPRPAEARITLADISRAENVLGWHPSVSLHQGLQVLDLFEKNTSSGLIITGV
jgi:UDP-glucose 4-epimerase